MLRKLSDALIVVATVGALLAPAIADAQQESRRPEPMFRIQGTQPEPDRTQRQSALTERTFNTLTSIHEQIGNEQYREAEGRLRELAGRLGRGNAYERALVLQNLGFVLAMNERYDEAIRVMNEALEIDALSHRETQDLFRTLASMYGVREQWADVLRVQRRFYYWEDNPSADDLILTATAHAQREEYREGLVWVQRAIQRSRTPRENWYQLWLAMHHQLGEFEESTEVLAQMISLWPDKTSYWQQLAGLLWAELRREEDALAVWGMAYRRGLITEERDILNVVRGYMYRGAPYTAARILREGLQQDRVEPTRQNWELLSQAFQLAQEHRDAIGALQRAAALAPNGELYIREAQLHASIDDWQGVQRAVQNALQKGGLQNPGRAWMMTGMAAYENKQYQEAIRAFRQAQQHPDSRRLAGQWIQHINYELQVQRELREGI